MAITIQEQPYTITRVGQKLIIRATSTNVANDGFKFVFRVTDYLGNVTEHYITPNPVNQGIFDLRQVAQGVMSVDVNGDVLKTSVVIADLDELNYPLFSYNISVFESWLIDGVLTINEESEELTGCYLLPCSSSVRDGYRPDPQNDYGFENLTTVPNVSRSLMMTDRTPNTHKLPTLLPFLNNFTPADYVPIPVRKSEIDWGTLQVITEGDNGDTVTAANLWCRWLLIRSNLTSVSYSEELGSKGISYLPAYPANLNEGGIGTVIPANFPNWRYYTIQLFNQDPANVVGLEAMSALYVFYPVDDNCVNDNVRVCWWSPYKGGYDFFNFQLTNEETLSVERKRYKKIVGNYATANDGFTFNTSDRGLTEAEVTPTTVIDITSDWIQEGEFELLRGLVQSKYVWIMSDEGNMTAVTVEDNSFTVDRKRDGKLKRVKMKLRYANEIFTF